MDKLLTSVSDLPRSTTTPIHPFVQYAKVTLLEISPCQCPIVKRSGVAYSCSYALLVKPRNFTQLQSTSRIRKRVYSHSLCLGARDETLQVKIVRLSVVVSIFYKRLFVCNSCHIFSQLPCSCEYCYTVSHKGKKEQISSQLEKLIDCLQRSVTWGRTRRTRIVICRSRELPGSFQIR